MSGSAVASLTATRDAFGPESLPSEVETPEAVGAGPSRWQRARLVLDQHQRGVDAGPVGQVLPVRAELADLLPHRGLRRGSTVAVRGSTTVLLALLAEATADGSWAGVVGMPDLGLLAAAELGIEISRLALVPKPGAEFGRVVAALLDGLDLVVVAGKKSPDGATGALARRLSARARHRESVLLSVGAWPGADLELDCAESSWAGLGDGHGHLVERALTVTVRGRGAATRPVRGRLTLPAGPSRQPGSHRPTQPRIQPAAQPHPQTAPQSRPGNPAATHADPAAFTARLRQSESQEADLAALTTTPSTPTPAEPNHTPEARPPQLHLANSADATPPGTALAVVAASSGTASSGTASSGTASSGTASSGIALPGTALPGTASSGIALPGTALPGTASSGTAVDGLAVVAADASTDTPAAGGLTSVDADVTAVGSPAGDCPAATLTSATDADDADDLDPDWFEPVDGPFLHVVAVGR